jgi:NTE family protein
MGSHWRHRGLGGRRHSYRLHLRVQCQKINKLLGRDADLPDIIDTVMTSINIMQERITRINLAVEPPDILIQPRLGTLKMMDFDQVNLTIEEGYISVKEKIEDIKALFENPCKVAAPD